MWHDQLRNGVIGAALAALLAAGPALASQPEDAWITTRVKMKLLTAQHIDPFDINVDTFDGNITLHGRVESPDLRQTAETLAAEVGGVGSVRNLLAVVPEAAEDHVEAADQDLRAQVETLLERDTALENSEIEVASVNDGIVLLSGETDSLSAHERALEDARSVAGVQRVASDIRSPDELADRELWSDEGGSSESALANAASDSWITTVAKVRLMAEPGISPLAVNVDTRSGVVTLFGTVTSEEKKALAQSEVEKISGVRAVENDLQVVPEGFANRVEAEDEHLASSVRQRLDEREALRGADIDVEVSNGVVRLSGTVASYEEKVMALTVARMTSGVGAIVDGLRVDANEG